MMATVPELKLEGVLNIEGRKAKVYMMGKCRIIVGSNETPDGSRWHLSISHPFRYPHWDEIATAREQLLPADLHFVMPLPKIESYFSLSDRCFHLWELRDPPLAEEFEGSGTLAKELGKGGRQPVIGKRK